ncbi:MAG: hypothetical protein FJW46_00675 [Actinobacteria bacterium]|nr:hypothetical protein [Actinomycetota bacterium]
MDLVELKSRWNDVLDLLERRDRVAWIAYFDARLASLDDDVLTLQFIDAEKMSGAHDYKATRNDRIRGALESAIKEVTGNKIRVIEI